MLSVDWILFILLAAVAVLSAGFMLASRNAVHSALYLVLNFATVAVFFLLLGAPFIAMMQVTVYAGAIMVLFLFVIMLLDLKEEERRKVKKLGLVAGLISVGAIVAIFVRSLIATNPGKDLPAPTAVGDTATLGKMLFTSYLLPFEIVSILLLVAMVGVILLSKKDLK